MNKMSYTSRYNLLFLWQNKRWAFLWITVLTIHLLILATTAVQAAVAPGTVIQNSATINYQVNSVNMPSRRSNTDAFSVVATLNLNQGKLTSTSSNINLFPNNTATFEISLTNDGVNPLKDGFLFISLSDALNFQLTDPRATLQSQNTINGITTYQYSIASLLADESSIYIASLHQPPNIQINSNALNISYRANRVNIASVNDVFNLGKRTDGILQLLQYSADSDATFINISPTKFLQDNGDYGVITPPVLEETGVNVISAPIPVKPATNFTHKQIIFIQLHENDHNINRSLKDTVEVDFNVSENGETERIQLTETDVNSGIFTGYITLSIDSTVIAHNGKLNLSANTKVRVNYTDTVDNSDSSSQIILVDPYGLIFDSSTGILLNGYTVSMVNADTGLPAQVFGDDGVSNYPSTVVTGGSVTDSSGTIYHFSEGAYRFPFAAIGNYKLIVTPPNNAAYVWPSQQTNELINQLPNAPYAITLGSRGEIFPLQAGPPLHIDIPVDRMNGQLYIRRSANIQRATPGDFIQFTVSIESLDDVAVENIMLTEKLPQGFRLEPKSVLINGQKTNTSNISNNGRELTFNLSTLNANELFTIEYVVSIGAMNPGVVRSTSFATANNGATQSNTATVNTHVTEALMRSRAILTGQVIIEKNSDNSQSKKASLDNKNNKNHGDNQGLKGVRIYLEDGRYAITDERGMYHFDNITPGSHVVQLDLDTLPAEYETILSKNNTRYAGRAWSQFVDLQGGTLWRSDFYVRLKPSPQGNISLQIQSSKEKNADELKYSIVLNNQAIDLNNRRLTFMIPAHTQYKTKSSHLNTKNIPDPIITENMLTFQLGKTHRNSQDILSFVVNNVSKSVSPEMLSKTFMLFDTPEKKNQRTPVITHVTMLETSESLQTVTEKMVLGIHFGSADDQINIEDQYTLATFAKKIKNLKNLRIHAVGHSDNRSLLPKTKLRFKDNYHLSTSRATAIANALRDLLKLPPSHITVEGRGSDEPVASNATPEGQRENRRVHLYIYSDKTPVHSNSSTVQTQKGETLVIPIQGTHAINALNKIPNVQPYIPQEHTIDFNQKWLAQQPAGIEWLSPKTENLPQLATTRIIIKHDSHQRIRLLMNEKQVEKRNFEGTLKHQNGNAISSWHGVDLNKGTNRFEAIVYDKYNNEIQRLHHTMHFSTEPVKAEIIKEQSKLIADGIQNPIIAIRLLDQDGYPVRNGIKGQFKISPPYQAILNQNFNIDAMSAAMANLHEYQVTQDGIALITLNPTTESGNVRISLPFTNNTIHQLNTKLTAQSTPWILVGLAEGTVGHKTLTEKSVALSENERQDDLYQDNRIAFFAKGKIQGKWLMTIAYDSNKKRPNNIDPELFQRIDPDTYYTLYGDTAYNGYAASSSEPLYLKLEQDQFYFLFGDYQTGLNDTQLAKYNRTLTGIKAHYNDEYYNVIMFSSNTNQAFAKDEFRGKGITGPYQLSRSNIAMNSEKIIIEVRDRFRSEIILSTTELSRHQDYQIDYQTGIISFRSPVYSTDLDINPQYIVVKYESFDSGKKQLSYGGRAQIALNKKLTLGITHINEGQTAQNTQLDAIDARYQLTENIKLTVEAAQSINDKSTTNNTQGNSHFAELEHKTRHSNSKIYIRDQEQNFGLGQTNSSENGLRKIGIETTLKTSKNTALKGLAYQQKNTTSNTTRNVLEVEGKTRIGKTEIHLGTRSVDEETNNSSNLPQNNSSNNTQQLTAGIRHHFMDNKISTSIHREQNLTGDNSVDFPNRTRLGAQYRITPKTSLFIEQDITDGALNNTRNTLIGIKASPWNGGELYSGITQSSGSQGNNTSSNINARQTWQLNKQWRLDFGAEEVKILDADQQSSSNREPSNDISFATPITNEFTAASFGTTYLADDWMWSTRIETRDGNIEDRWQLATSIQTSPNNHLSTLTTLAFSDSQQRNGLNKQETTLRIGFAYRPFTVQNQGNWILLNKLDLKQTNTNNQASNSWRMINHFNANYKRDRWQLSLQYAAKTVSQTLNNKRYNSFTDLAGFETRYDLTPKWDMGIHGNLLRSVNLNQYDYNTGLSIGRTLAKNMWVSLGYNFTGFHDEDFSHSRNTSEGAFLRFRIKFDQSTVRDAVQWVGQ